MLVRLSREMGCPTELTERISSLQIELESHNDRFWGKETFKLEQEARNEQLRGR